MGINLDRNARIAGYRPSVFKNALRSFSRTRSPGRMIDLQTVFSRCRDGAIVFEECLDRGLIDPATINVTPAGEVIICAKAQSRTPLNKALMVLNEFLDRIETLNRDPDGGRHVEQVWLFGSVMRSANNVGDIDLAVTSSRRARFADDHEGRKGHLDHLVAQMPGAPVYSAWPWEKEGWLFQRAIYGARRHPLLAGVQKGTAILESLGVPCRLIYDRSRGGRVDDPILPRHPNSRGRSNDLSPPAEMPDIRPKAIGPMDARWVAGFQKHGRVLPYLIFGACNDEARALFPCHPEGLRVVGDDHELSDYPWTPKRLKRPGLDGRNAVALISATEWSGTSVILCRQIEVKPLSWTLHAGFSDMQLYRARRYEDPATLRDLAAVTALILAVDAERMLRRATELPQSPTIRIAIDDEGLTGDLRSFFVSLLRGYLEKRTVRIEPPDWSGKRVLLI
jgi:hypothetical protein